jgi:hypothetical protein
LGWSTGGGSSFHRNLGSALAELQDVAVAQHGFARDPRAIEEQPIGALQVDDLVAVGRALEPSVVAAGGVVGFAETQAAGGIASQGDRGGELFLAEHGLLVGFAA